MKARAVYDDDDIAPGDRAFIKIHCFCHDCYRIRNTECAKTPDSPRKKRTRTTVNYNESSSNKEAKRKRSAPSKQSPCSDESTLAPCDLAELAKEDDTFSNP